jgi:hypothetical protein
MLSATQNALAGQCSNGGINSASAAKRGSFDFPVRFPQSPVPISMLLRRDETEDETWWQWVWDVACDDLVDTLLDAINEDIGAMIELICAVKDLYDDASEMYQDRAAFGCANSGCYYNQPPSTYWDYTASWTVQMGIPPGPIVSSNGGSISCVDCSLAVSEL